MPRTSRTTGLPGLVEVRTHTHDVGAGGGEVVDRVAERVDPEVHAVVPGEGDHVEPGVDQCGRPSGVGTDRVPHLGKPLSTFGERKLELAETDVRAVDQLLVEREQVSRAIPVGTDVADGDDHDVVGHVGSSGEWAGACCVVIVVPGWK